MRLLVAEAEPALGNLISRAFQADGHEITLTHDGEEAVSELKISPDLVLIDLNLPKRDGMEVLGEIRRWRAEVPVLVLTSRADLDTRIACLDEGADDFLAKPFSTRELRARCRALLRRAGNSASILRHAGIALDRVQRTVSHEGRPVSLTNKEFALLEYLMASGGKCVSRAALLEHVWPAQEAANTNVIDVYVNYLRRKLDGSRGSSLIQTVRGSGYRLASPSPEIVLTREEMPEGFTNEAPMWGIHGNSHGEQQFGCGIAR